jgi:hypothetical protein
LFYDGSRSDRHAFAGLRIVPISATTATATTIVNPMECTDTSILYQENEHEEVNKDSKAGGVVNFPLPTPYDLTGFVRALNTAGKLALIALVMKVEGVAGGSTSDAPTATATGNNVTDKNDEYRVAIVDLVLEKVLTAQAHVRKRRRGANNRKGNAGGCLVDGAEESGRKEVGLHLEKKRI